MPIAGRELHSSERKVALRWKSPGNVVSQGITACQVITGSSAIISVIDAPCVVESARAIAEGVSNAMQVALLVKRFASAGATDISLGISNMILQNFSTSGMQGYSGLAAAGSTLLSLQAGDVLEFQTSVSNGNAVSLFLEVVVRKTQDIVSTFGNQ